MTYALPIKTNGSLGGQAGEGEGIASCGGSFEPDGWIKLLFGPDNRLTFVRIDAFQGN